MNPKDANYLRSVREHYENYPYPERDPENEKRCLPCTNSDFLGKISHYCYRGKKDLRVGGRALVAGGGTGDAVIYLAEQFRHTGCEVVYLDISQVSMDVARQRAKIRGLENIRWVSGSILDLPKLGLGFFDYVNCSGVLHHLDDPSAGLKALCAVLADDGCLGLQVYGLYGRTGINQAQTLMRLLNADEPDLQKQVENTRRLLRELPPTNWYRRSGTRWYDQALKFSDTTIVYQFLHSQDRAYSVPELYEWLDGCGVTLQAFSGSPGTRLQYEPLQFVQDAELRAKFQGMDLREQQAVAELLFGDILKHTFYATINAEPQIASLDDPDMMPYFTLEEVNGVALARACAGSAGKPLKIALEQSQVSFSLQPERISKCLFESIDGDSTLEQIIHRTAERFVSETGDQASPQEIRQVFLRAYKVLNTFDLLLLRHKSIPAYPPIRELHAQMLKDNNTDTPR